MVNGPAATRYHARVEEEPARKRVPTRYGDLAVAIVAFTLVSVTILYNVETAFIASRSG
jgi:hypothetical protein